MLIPSSRIIPLEISDWPEMDLMTHRYSYKFNTKRQTAEAHPKQ